MSEDLELVRSRVNIVDVVGKRVSLKKAGKDFKGICPFHDDKSPSMHVSPKMGIFKCFVCGAGGDAFSFVMKYQRVDFGEALRILADEVGVTLTKISREGGEDAAKKKAERQAIIRTAQTFFVEELKNTKPALDYCERRGITQEVIEEWGIGFGPAVGEAMVNQVRKAGQSLEEARALFLIEERETGGYYDRFRGRLIFPIRDESGKIVAFGGRIIGDGQPKYINSGDTPIYSKRRVLYGFDKAKSQIASEKKAVLVEGYLDVIACHRAGVKTAVASLGTSLTEDQAGLISKWAEDVVVLYDADSAGEKAALKAQELLEAVNVRVRLALMPDGQDPDTLLRNAGPQAVVAAVTQSLTPLDFKLLQIKKTLDPKLPEFWDRVIEVLAEAHNELEIQQHLMELAGLYPSIKDRTVAAKALRMEIQKKRGKQNLGRIHSQRPSAPKINRNQGLHPYEVTIFKGLFDPQLAPTAWTILLRNDIFVTEKASKLVETLKELGDEMRSKEALSWMTKIPEESQELLSGLSIGELVTTSIEQLIEAEKLLIKQKEQRDIKDNRLEGIEDDEALRKIQERLKKLKNSDNDIAK